MADCVDPATLATLRGRPDVKSKPRRKTTFDARLRRWLLTQVNRGTDTVVAFQRFFGVTPECPEGHPLLTAYFRFGAALGQEVTFILFLPFIFWNGPLEGCVWALTMWVASYYVGQVVKDLMRLPRPPHPPVVRMEKHYDEEYGLPSTHVMGCTVPWSLAAYAILTDACPWYYAAAFAAAWTVTVTSSRLYLGVHSPADIIVGAGLAVAIFGLYFPYYDTFGKWILYERGEVLVAVPMVALCLLCVYPSPPKWTPAYGDTAIIVGVATGVLMGVSVNDEKAHLALSTAQLMQESVLSMVARHLLGYGTLFATRAAGKAITVALFTWLSPSNSVPYNRRYAIEIPYKFVTYSLVGFNAVYTAPILMKNFGLA